jgi:hypothetical protein
LTANATSGENDAAAKAIRDQNLRSGGTNTSGTIATIKDLALRKMRMADVLNAQRSAGDYSKNVDYQMKMAQEPLAVVSGESPYFGTSTSGRSAALGRFNTVWPGQLWAMEQFNSSRRRGSIGGTHAETSGSKFEWVTCFSRLDKINHA